MIDSLSSTVARACAEHGGRTALICGEESLTYAEFDGRVDRFAGGLHSLSVGPQSRIILHMANGWQWAVAFHAIMRLCAVVIPVNALLTADEVSYIAGHAGASHAILDAQRAGLADQLTAEHGTRCIVDGGTSANTESFAQLLSGAPLGHIAEVSADDLAAIIYTSGTTGHPKGAMIPQRALALNAAMVRLMHGRTSRDVTVSALPLAHVYGNVVLNASLCAGATLVLFATFDVDAVRDAIARYEATMFEGVPTMYFYLLAAPDDGRKHKLRLCTIGGQTMPVDKLVAAEALFHCPIAELWGMTELAGVGTTHPHTGPGQLGSIGVPLPFLEARIASDASTGDLPFDEVGELIVRGPLVMLGYLDNPEATAETITPDGWLRTGDLARRDPAGFIHVVDRKKDMILTAGYNIYPAELERAISAHPAVAMVAVGRDSDPVKGEIAAAYIVLRPGSEASEDAIREHCRKLLASYKIPRRIHFVSDLPKTSTGKILRRSLGQVVTP